MDLAEVIKKILQTYSRIKAEHKNKDASHKQNDSIAIFMFSNKNSSTNVC